MKKLNRRDCYLNILISNQLEATLFFNLVIFAISFLPYKIDT